MKTELDLVGYIIHRIINLPSFISVGSYFHICPKSLIMVFIYVLCMEAISWKL